MVTIKKFYPEVQLGGFTDIDGTIAFYNRVNALIQPSFCILDVGCGRGEYDEDTVPYRRTLRIMKDKVRKVIGIDMDKGAEKNHFIDEFHHLKSFDWPIKDNAIDMIICDCVVEHIETPAKFFSEAARVLKDDGFICIRTPNQWNYASIAAKLIPNSYHSKITSYVQEKRKEEDVFPTFYRCNSIKKLKGLMKQNGFEKSIVYGHEAEPSYLSFSQAAYFIGTLHQRFAPSFFKSTIFAFGKLSKNAIKGQSS